MAEAKTGLYANTLYMTLLWNSKGSGCLLRPTMWPFYSIFLTYLPILLISTTVKLSNYSNWLSSQTQTAQLWQGDLCLRDLENGNNAGRRVRREPHRTTHSSAWFSSEQSPPRRFFSTCLEAPTSFVCYVFSPHDTMRTPDIHTHSKAVF